MDFIAVVRNKIPCRIICVRDWVMCSQESSDQAANTRASLGPAVASRSDLIVPSEVRDRAREWISWNIAAFRGRRGTLLSIATPVVSSDGVHVVISPTILCEGIEVGSTHRVAIAAEIAEAGALEHDEKGCSERLSARIGAGCAGADSWKARLMTLGKA